MEKYRIIRKLSESTASKVNLAESSNRKLVVIKEIIVDRDRISFNESKILAGLSHPNILKLIETFLTGDGKVCIVTEYCEGGDLGQQVHSLSSVDIRGIIVQLLLAVKYLHDKNILHRDLKLKNIFVSSRPDDKIFRIKIGDFGVARSLENSQMATTMIGTPYYLSPELCASQPYDKSADIWSLGCVVYEILNRGRHPFNARTLEDLLGRIQEEPVDYSGINDARMVEMLKRILCKNPRDRLTIDGILHLPIIQEYIQDFVNKINNFDSMPTILASPPTTQIINDSFSNTTTDELLNTMRKCMMMDQRDSFALKDQFDAQIFQARQCLKFIQNQDPARLKREVDRVRQNLSKFLILPSRINRFIDSVKRSDYAGVRDLGGGDETFLKETLSIGLIGDVLVMQEIEEGLKK